MNRSAELVDDDTPGIYPVYVPIPLELGASTSKALSKGFSHPHIMSEIQLLLMLKPYCKEYTIFLCSEVKFNATGSKRTHIFCELKKEVSHPPMEVTHTPN